MNLSLVLRLGRFCLLLSLAAVSIFPLLWMFLGSLRPHEELFQYSTSWNWHLLIPERWTLQNHIDIFLDPTKPFGRYLWNTFVVSSLLTVFSLFFNSLAAFAFSKLRFPGKAAIFACFLSSLVIPGEVTMIPNFLLMHDLGWLDSYKALIIPGIISVFSVFLLNQLFAEVPRELLEAGIMDGASWFRIYRSIMLPASVPALVTLGIWSFLGTWDNYVWPLIVINDDRKQMIQVAIASYSSLFEGTDWGKILAADAISTLPILILFLFLQRYYIQGITMTGIKG